MPRHSRVSMALFFLSLSWLVSYAFPASGTPIAVVARDSAGADSVAGADSTRERLADSLALGRRAAAALVRAPGPALVESAGVAPAPSIPVFLGGQEIFRVRTGRGGLDADRRAVAIRARLTAAVADTRVPADSVAIAVTEEGIVVRLGLHPLFVITPEDVEGMTTARVVELTTELPSRVRAGIERERRGRTPLHLVVSAGIALALTLVAWVLLLLGIRALAWYRLRLGRLLWRVVPAIRIRNFEVLPKRQFVDVTAAVLSRIDIVFYLLLAYWYLTALFSLFPWTQGWSWWLLHFARNEAWRLLTGLGSALPGLVVIVVIVIAARWVVRLSDRFFDALASGALALAGFHPDLALPSRRLARIGIWIVAVMVAYQYVPGAQLRAVQGISILLGLMVSLGSTSFVGNVIAGIVLTFSRSFSPGERVQIGEHVGDVVALGLLMTKLRSLYDEEITIPNGQVAAGSIVNYSRLAAGAGLLLHTQVTIGYDAEWRQVHALLIEAAGRISGIEKEPAPRVFQRALGDYYVTYELTCMTRDANDQRRLYSDLHAEIQDAFARAGVEILSPAYHALRDANAPALPRQPSGPRAAPGGFRVRPPDGGGAS